MSEIDSIGDAVTGALLASSVEPKTGKDGHTKERACLNCSANLLGPYCAQCGQRAHVHRTLAAFGHDLLHGVLHFEGKFWRTLPLLALKPGQLTRRYIDGQRARYISPIALFLFVVFITFATFSIVGSRMDFLVGNDTAVDVSAEVARSERTIAALETELKSATPAERTALEGRLETARHDLQMLKRIQTDGVAAVAVDQIARSEVKLGERKDEATPSSQSWLTKAWDKARKHPDLLAYKLQMTAYKFAWLLIPVSLPFMWLLFPFNRRYRMYDHTVFVTYSLSVMLFLVLVSAIGVLAGIGGLVMASVVIAPVYLAIQLKGAYQLSLAGTLLRLPLLYAFCFLSLVIWILLLVLIGVAG